MVPFLTIFCILNSFEEVESNDAQTPTDGGGGGGGLGLDVGSLPRCVRHRSRLPGSAEGQVCGAVGGYFDVNSCIYTFYFIGGGGGAPLKDVSGGTVTNLRSVIRGSVEVNHNPLSAGSPSKWKGVRHDDSDSHDSGRSDSYDSEEEDRRRSRNRRGNDDRRGRSRSTDRNERRNDDRRRVHTPEIPGLTINTSPKKGLGSALKDMNASESLSEKEFRNRKELEYQNQLRQQIEEKRRIKEAENKKNALTKHKELEEYYFTFYKGNVPSHIKKELKQAARKLRGDDDDDEIDGDNNYYRSDDRKSNDRRDRNKNIDSYEEPPRTSRLDKPKTERSERTRSTSRGRVKDNYDSDTDVQDKRKSSRSGDQGWVSQTEYDELSALCEKLLQQQKDLQIEIKNQAKVINELQQQSGVPIKGTVFNKQGRSNVIDSDNISVGSKSVRSKSAVARSRVIDAKGNKNNIAVQQPKAPNGERRPSSTHSLGSRNRAVSKDRFGNKITPKEAPVKVKNLRVNGQNSPEKAPPLKLKSINFSNDDEPPSNIRNGGGGNGFQKLAAMRSGGPIVVVHDENIDYNERNVQPAKSALKKSSAGTNSIELNGNSEMLRIGGEEVDMISGDQLDRLLVQAKKARAPAGAAYNRFANLD